MTIRIHRYLMRQLWVTVSAVTLFVILIVIGEESDGWVSITYLCFALATVALWLTVSAVYTTYIIICWAFINRDNQP
ncbi:MAG: hypothetical protein CFH41_00190 [Alphaproteobacteria bacterium MarineAlpha11_Bin1]|nr:MAG: hypothetical protein CFH41_00190 [Alphaproteobacteria bacterium MarineAlpha11_Bin1]